MAAYRDLDLQFQRKTESLWSAVVSTRDGPLEIVVRGEGSSPDTEDLELLRPFFRHTSEIVRLTRKELRFGSLYRLVRIGTNDGKLFLQFKNRVTRSEKIVFSYEHKA